MLGVIAPAAPAVDFELGDISGRLDTTLSWGQNYRVSARDPDLVGIANGGNAYSVNADDGNLNYDRGLISNAFLVTSELEAHYRNFGLFVRGTGLRDTLNDGGSTERTPLTEAAIDRVGKDLRLLDAYLSVRFDVADRPAELRIGEQVVNWGESTFIQNGINAINPFDVSKLRVPGAELREALLPVGVIWGNLSLSPNLSLEAFYQYDHEETELEPPGTYFSTNDFVGDGGRFVYLGFGGLDDFIGDQPSPVGAVPRGADDRPEHGGQYGAALRAYLPDWNYSEVGFYFINYHSRLPIVNARTGTAAGAMAGNYPGSARYFISYPEDIRLFGASLNTELGNTGIALQGEISHRLDQPLQVDDVELLFAALGAQCGISPAACPLANQNQIGSFGFATDVPGHIERDVSQLQFTATKVLGPLLKANQGLLLAEVGITHVHDMPDKRDLRLDGPGTFISGNEALAAFHAPTAAGETESWTHFADATSWGYRLVGRLEYNNVFAGINLQPRIAWSHDVSGTTPAPITNFVEDRKAVTLGLKATYQQNWEADFSYTNFFGAGRHNLLNDRDFASFTLRYSF
ncbi:hypothetical protein J2T55_000334 [Methylohalomonas lacus]|uniref:DUF1302 domain-containing protein n=1 Tax=Methylohalomonas lacus TaxID=398773 RepID=A0AAE3HKX1_9GAMM|nr:hypothetical protein [Methylohalomonas lacus]